MSRPEAASGDESLFAETKKYVFTTSHLHQVSQKKQINPMLSRHELGRCLRRPLSSSSNRKALGSTYDVIRISPNSKTISKSERVNIRSILTQNQSSIHARDILSLSIADNKPGRPLILPRGEAVIVSLDHVKAIIFKVSEQYSR